jgi:SAM-dependent methyltransferase
MVAMSERRPSIARRIARAFRRCRELLSTPELMKEFVSQLAEVSKSIDALSTAHSADLGAMRDEARDQLREQIRASAAQSEVIISQLAEVSKSIDELSTAFNAGLDAMRGELKVQLNNLKSELSAQLAFSFYDQAELSTSLNSRLNSLETFQSESRNLLGHLDTSLNSRMNSVETFQSETRNQQFETKNLVQHVNTSVESRLNLFEGEMLPAISYQIHELIAAQFDLFNEIDKNRTERAVHPAERYKPAKSDQWNASLNRAKREFRAVYPLWEERLDAMLQAFRQSKVGNAAWSGDVYSRVFRGFVDRYASGRVLDVGCGIFGRPYYLASYPSELVSGLDPLKPEREPDFELVRGISEYLPWPDASFSTAISATSLDHCLSLSRSLAELRRVLRPGGCFLLWIGSVPGAPKYEPDSLTYEPSDQFHLFHFDVSWLDPMLSNTFKIIDRIELHKVGYSHVMYCLEREADPARGAKPDLS